MVKYGHFNPPFALDVSKLWEKKEAQQLRGKSIQLSYNS